MNSQPDTSPQKNLSDIAETIKASAEGEKALSREERVRAAASFEMEQKELQISKSDYENLLRYILWTIAVIGLFFIIGSFAAACNEDQLSKVLEEQRLNDLAENAEAISRSKQYAISDSLLGLGIELLASAGLVAAISYCMTKDGATPRSLMKEKTLIYVCLGIGLLLLSVPIFMTEQSWCRNAIQSVGCELFGGGVLITLFENLERKFRA